MSAFTIDDLRRVLREAAGEDAGITLDGDILDAPLNELGYDSLALLEVAAIVQRSYGVPVPDDAALQMTTPRQAMGYINQLLTGVPA
jgi:minimal PKS acyl carrier protein